MSRIYKIASQEVWKTIEQTGIFEGAEIDIADGFIHFSSASQVAETAAKHFAGRSDLVLVSVNADNLGDDLRWEPSRGGELFPHLYRRLKLEEVETVWEMPLGDNGKHQIPKLD